MNTLCEVCNKEKEQCFICKGRSSSGCVEHSINMTTFDSKPVCKYCLLLNKCTVNIAEKDIYETPRSHHINKPENICYRFVSIMLNFIFLYWEDILTPEPEPEPEPVVIECNQIKKCCYICRNKETINCPIHNPNIKNTCDKCVKLLLCQKCNEIKETTWDHKCGRFCIDCVKKIEIDISPKTLCNLFEDTSTEYIPSLKWDIYCEKCIEGSVLDIQKKEYIKITKK